MPKNYIYDHMYRAQGPWRKRFYENHDPLDVEDDDGEYLVQGFMGTTHSPEIKISLYPADEERLAPTLKPKSYCITG